ncbi:hypothetical protein ACXX9E_29285 [Pseudomonas sp. GNP014]
MIIKKSLPQEITDCALEHNSSIYCYELSLYLFLLSKHKRYRKAIGEEVGLPSGKNYFGMKEFNLTEPHMKAKLKPNATWGLRKYYSMCDSVLMIISTCYRQATSMKSFQELLLQQWFLDGVEVVHAHWLIPINYAESPNYVLEDIEN